MNKTICCETSNILKIIERAVFRIPVHDVIFLLWRKTQLRCRQDEEKFDKDITTSFVLPT